MRSIMATEREIQEMIARCVSIMVFYYNSGRSAHTKDQMAAEVGAVAHFVKKWRLVDDLRVRILDSVTAEMIARYGSELGFGSTVNSTRRSWMRMCRRKTTSIGGLALSQE